MSGTQSGLALPDVSSGFIAPVMPVAPPDYKGYLCDRGGSFVLEKLNAHDRDCHLKFTESTHQYCIDGVPTLGSVTGLVHRYASSFEPNQVIQRMMNSSNWPRPQYMKSDVVIALASASCSVSVPEVKHLLGRIRRQELQPEEICREVQSIVELFPEIREELCSAVSLDAEDIISMWDTSRDDAAGRGTYMHQQFEYYLNRGLVSSEGSEMKMFLAYISTLGGWAVYRTEWMIYGTDEWLGGSIDCAAIDSSGSIMLIDWKRSRGLPQKYVGYGRFMLAPLQDLPDCAGWHYRLQLNSYKYILEKYYDCAVSQMYIVCTHPEHGDFPFIDSVEPMEKETESIMAEQRLLASEYLGSLRASVVS